MPKPVWHRLFHDTFVYTVCGSEKELRAAFRDIKVTLPDDRDYAGIVYSRYSERLGTVNIIHVPNWDITVVGLRTLVHEATHVVQNLMAHIGETRPSSEFQAYLVEEVFARALKHVYPIE